MIVGLKISIAKFLSLFIEIKHPGPTLKSFLNNLKLLGPDHKKPVYPKKHLFSREISKTSN